MTNKWSSPPGHMGAATQPAAGTKTKERMHRELDEAQAFLEKHYTLQHSLKEAALLKNQVKQLSLNRIATDQFLKEEMKKRPLNIRVVKELEVLVRELRKIREQGRQTLREARALSKLRLEDYLGCLQERYDTAKQLSFTTKHSPAEEDAELARFLEKKDSDDRLYSEENYQVQENFQAVQQCLQEYHSQLAQFNGRLANSCLSEDIKVCIQHSIAVDHGLSFTELLFDQRALFLVALSVVSLFLGLRMNTETSSKHRLKAWLFFVPPRVLALGAQGFFTGFGLLLSAELSYFLATRSPQRKKSALSALHSYTVSYLLWAAVFQLGLSGCSALLGVCAVFLLSFLCSLPAMTALEKLLSNAFVVCVVFRLIYLIADFPTEPADQYENLCRYLFLPLYLSFLGLYYLFLYL